MMAACAAGQCGASVLVLERNEQPGRKILITGKGRCNLTNDSDRATFLTQIPRNPKFLFSAFNHFFIEETKEFFESRGVPLKTERGRRVFPVSDRASDIRQALESACRKAGVSFARERVTGIRPVDDGTFEVDGPQGAIKGRTVVLATGGLSYPRTGSTGDGYRLARELGHTVTGLCPSLVPLVSADSRVRELQGLSLRNVGLKIRDADQKTVYEDFGEMLFTHFGLSGPIILSASAHLPASFGPGQYCACLDLKPALDEKTLDARILRDFSAYANRDLENGVADLLPSKMIPVLLDYAGLDPRKKVHEITSEERRRLRLALKDFRVRIDGTRPVEEAVITRGGIDVRQVTPSTMESKRVKGLYFAGEILDVDAYTGGFNLQIAFSTGHLAGTSAALAARSGSLAQ